MSLTNRKLNYFRKDEKMATKEYAEAARKAKYDEMKDMFKEMSRDEAKHAKYIEKMLKMNKAYKKRNRQPKTFIFDDVDD